VFSTKVVRMMSPWITQEVARSHTDDLRRTAQARLRASDAPRRQPRWVVTRHLGEMLIRCGQRLAGADSDALIRPPGYTYASRADRVGT
jgi:hypothetical protein